MLQKQVEKLNRQNTEHSHGKAGADAPRGEDRGGGGGRQELAELILDGPHASDAQLVQRKKDEKEEEEEEGGVFEDSEGELKAGDVGQQQVGEVEDDETKKKAEESSTAATALSLIPDICKGSLQSQERYF